MSDCIFCKIVAGDIPSTKIFRGRASHRLSGHQPAGADACSRRTEAAYLRRQRADRSGRGAGRARLRRHRQTGTRARHRRIRLSRGRQQRRGRAAERSASALPCARRAAARVASGLRGRVLASASRAREFTYAEKSHCLRLFLFGFGRSISQRLCAPRRPRGPPPVRRLQERYPPFPRLTACPNPPASGRNQFP